jgi:hypothetical protein
MSEQTESLYTVFEDGYTEPKAEEKAALIADLQAGNFTLSFSSLSAFAISPRAFVAYKLQERKETKAMQLGTAVHCLVLEPDEFEKRYFVAPNVNGATKEGKATWAKIYEDFCGPLPDGASPKIDEIKAAIFAATGTTVLDGATAADAQQRARCVVRNRAARSILDRVTRTEVKVQFEFEGIQFRGMVDGRGPGLIADLKNMPDATYDRATGAIWARRLHWQAFGYDAALGGGHNCHIIAVDPVGEVSVHCFNMKHLDSAERQMKRYVHEFKRCIVESIFEPEIWDASQEYWLTTTMNPEGINYL